jgi:carbamoyltransferase
MTTHSDQPRPTMPTYILGISAYFHDSAAALLRDGQIVAAAQEERFTRKKHDPGFPRQAIQYCLAEAGITLADVEYAAFYEKPQAKFERLLETHAAFAPRSCRAFLEAMPGWLRGKLHLPDEIRRELGPQFRGMLLFTRHHESHAASAFFPSPFSEAAILTLDGVGEWATATLGHGRGNKVTLTHELRFPHSLGMLYSAFTHYTGFKVNSGEYKVMGLAPYGQPKYCEQILHKLMDLKPDGSFQLDMSYFDYGRGVTMTTPKFHDLFGGPPRKPETLLTQREMDLAASVQNACEEVMLRCARHLHSLTGLENLVMAGGVALNCVGNGRILREGPFRKIWVQPAAGDAGGALGAALIAHHHVLRERREPAPTDSMSGALLGPAFTDAEIQDLLEAEGAVYQQYDNEELLKEVAQLLAAGNVVGWMSGRMEFGPRALGSRSILGDPRSEKMQQVMNLKIKFRESFRPFAPAVLREAAPAYFDVPADLDSPYMLLVAPVAAAQRDPDGDARMRGQWGLDMLNVRRSTVPAITHIDYSARLQTVDADHHPRFYQLLKRFEESTGCPVLINTSFNIRGEPIVCTPRDAYRCFLGTQLDALVLENCLLLKEEQPKESEFDVESYKAQFQLD